MNRKTRWLSIWAVAMPAMILAFGESGIADEKDVVIENAYWRLKFDPEHGGICKSMVYKPAKKELSENGGVFRDYVQEQPMHGSDWADKPYAFSVDKLPDAVRLTLSRQGEKYQFITITKIITLLENSPVIRVDYEFANQAEAMGPVTISPRYHNTLYLPEPCVYSFAGLDGIRRLQYAHQATKQEITDGWEDNPSRAWGAMRGEESGIGVACLFSYPTVKRLLAWLGEGEHSAGTIEWFSNPITIISGKSWKDTWHILPFEGVEDVQEVSSLMVAGLRLENEPQTGRPAKVNLQLYSATDATARATYQIRRLPSMEWRTLGEKEMPLKTGQAASEAFDFTPAVDGTYVLKATVAAEGVAPIEVERPVIVGKRSAQYVLLPREQKVAMSQEKRYLPVEIKPDVVTPHWPWARPYAEGPVQVLFLMFGDSLREIVELNQRMDLKETHATLIGDLLGSSWYSPELVAKLSAAEVARQGYEEVDALLENSFDVIVLSACGGSRPLNSPAPVTWDKFTEKSRAAILDKVRAGAGLIVVQPEKLNLNGELASLYGTAQPCRSMDYLGKAVPFELFPSRRHRGYVVPYAGGMPPLTCGDLKTAALGKGRIAFFDYDTGGILPDTELEKTAFPCWEYEYSLFIRGILWAGQKVGKVSISHVETPDEIVVGNTNNGLVRAVLSGFPQGGKSVLSVKVVGEDGEAESDYEVPIEAAGDPIIDAPLPPLKVGRHLVTLTLHRDGKVADFHTSVVRVTGPFALEVALTNDVLRADESVRGEMTLRKEGEWQPHEGTVLEVRLVDCDARLVFTQSIPVHLDRTTYPLEVDFQDRLNRLYNLTVTLRTSEQVLAQTHKIVSCPSIGTTIDEVIVPLWSGPGGVNEKLDLETMRLYRAMGLSFHDAGGSRIRPCSYLAARAGIRTVGYNNFYRLTTFQTRESNADHIRKYGTERQCLSDTSFLESVGNLVTNQLKETLRYGASYYVLADEPSHFAYDTPCDACWCPDCQLGFRAWLQEHYGTIDALNRKWCSSFTSWEDVKPAWERDMKDEKENFAAWADFRNFMDQVYLDFNVRLVELKKEIVGDKPWGASGIEPGFAPIYSGNRWEKLKDVFSLYLLYGSTELQAALQGRILGGEWNGYCRPEGRYQHLSWTTLTRGGRLLPQYESGTFFLPDFRLSPHYGQPLKSMLDEMNGGLGTLLFHCERVTSPIAIHYSHPSAQAFYILKYANGAGTIKVFRRNMDDWKRLVRDLGYQPTFVSEEQLVGGVLDREGIRILILPLSVAMSDKELAAIRQFVEAGGVVIADCLSGKMDEHVALRETFPLDAIFGVKQDRSLRLVMDGGQGTLAMGR
ncbi:MAG: beta-galactosidase, partial [Kiritimatiellae bacterium]|nr:beta-galactosidase [Kiritimatiellia bacterium]